MCQRRHHQATQLGHQGEAFRFTDQSLLLRSKAAEVMVSEALRTAVGRKQTTLQCSLNLEFHP